MRTVYFPRVLTLMLMLHGISSVRAQHTTATANPAPHTAFTVTLLRDLPMWDANRDGVLSEAEVDRAVIDPGVTDEDAAAAATVKIFVRSGKYALPPLDAAYFARYERAAAEYRAARGNRRANSAASPAENSASPGDINSVLERGSSTTRPSEAAAVVRPSPDWDLMFSTCKRRIARTNQPGSTGPPNPVWPVNGLSLKNMRQGPLGDCYFVSVVGAMVARDPHEVEHLVKPIDGGKFRVTFPGSPPIVVGPLTQAQIAISSSTAGEGLWLAVLEQAFGRYRASVVADASLGATAGAHAGADAGSGSIAGAAANEIAEATDAIAKGGATGPTITALTGHARKRIGIPPAPALREMRKEKLITQIRAELKRAMSEHRLVAVGVSPPATQPSTLPSVPASSANAAKNGAATIPIPPGINVKHAYAVLSFDDATDTLELWNPHGQLFKPAGEPGIVNGYSTEHGVFKLPLSEAYRFVSSFTFELASPATQQSNPSAAQK